jgi:hypothetical protein
MFFCLVYYVIIQFKWSNTKNKSGRLCSLKLEISSVKLRLEFEVIHTLNTMKKKCGPATTFLTLISGGVLSAVGLTSLKKLSFTLLPFHFVPIIQYNPGIQMVFVNSVLHKLILSFRLRSYACLAQFEPNLLETTKWSIDYNRRRSQVHHIASIIGALRTESAYGTISCQSTMGNVFSSVKFLELVFTPCNLLLLPFISLENKLTNGLDRL